MISSLKDIISKEIRYQINEKIELCENENKNRQNTLKKIFITDIKNKDKIIAFKLDKYPTSKNYNKENKKGINKGVDAVIITEKHLLFIELKSTKIKEKTISEKVFASISFLKGISYLMKYFYNISIDQLIPGIIVFGLQKYNRRLLKSKPRENPIEFYNKQYSNNYTRKKLQVLEIKKFRSNNFEISLDKIVNNIRTKNKNFSSWP